MRTDLYHYTEFVKAIEYNDVVYLFGTGISSALTGKAYGWKKWITDGIHGLKNKTEADSLIKKLNSDDSVDNLIAVAGLILAATKMDGTYAAWMRSSFESNNITNYKLAQILGKLTAIGDVFVTTNYDLLLEQATGLGTLTYDNTAEAFNMLDKKQSTHVIHIHGVYDYKSKFDNIIANREQYESILNNEGAQFIQNLIGTHTLVMIGCGQTADDINIAKFIDFVKTHLKLDRQYFYLCKADCQVDTLPQNVSVIPYGSEYSDLTDFLEMLCDIRLTSFMNRNSIVGRNVYIKEYANAQGMSSYHFTREDIGFCGREEELDRLHSFLDVSEKFLWWAITGQGGSGKSRLALELLNRTKTDWFGFFLSDSATVENVKTFTAFKNTLIIVDYVKRKEKDLSQILVSLMNTFVKTEYKLRLIFLERECDTSTGSWYSELIRNIPADALSLFQTNEYNFLSGEHGFLNLGDMHAKDIVQFIGKVCRKNRLPCDCERDKRLMEEYRLKFEKLQFRPLFVQMYVEAWIDNACSTPRYDSYEDLLKFILDREQKRWLYAVNNDVKVCSALIRLIVFANCAGKIKISELPENVSHDWDIISDYIRLNNLPGKQSEDAFNLLLNEMCQSEGFSQEHINPLYPDILKEYMLIYYCSEQERLNLANYFWNTGNVRFAALITKCIYDFPFNEAIFKIVDCCDMRSENVSVLTTRLNFLKLFIFKNFDDAKNLADLLQNEYDFWNRLNINSNTSDVKLLTIIKFCGLIMCAQQFGAWLQIDKMVTVLEEAVSIKGGDELTILKTLAIEDRINALSAAGFVKEARELERKFSSFLKQKILSGMDGVIELNNLNNELMDYLLSENYYKANKVLGKMKSICNIGNIEEVRTFSLSCHNLARLAFVGAKPKYIYEAINILHPYYERYSDDTCVASRYLQAKLQAVQYDYFYNKTNVELAFNQIENKMQLLEPDKFTADIWASCKVFKLNFIQNNENEIKTQIEESVRLLKAIPEADTVVQVYINSVIALHKNVLKDKISKAEVETAYSYMLRFPKSENIRYCFFDMLEISTEKNYKAKYMPNQVLTGAFNDILFNPIAGSGIPELDELYNDSNSEDMPYVRIHRKIGRNEPCPCGSGKKFKKCCLGKGIYD